MTEKINSENKEDKKSILEQIITNNQAEEVANLDAVEIVSNLFGRLNERERDILARRFGLHSDEKETLENIGNIHKLTRERIRQIETSSIKKLRQLENIEKYISGLKKVINQLMEEHGGLMEREYLFNNLVKFSVGDTKAKDEDYTLHKNHLDFLISKLLHDYFEEVKNSKHFKHSFKLKHYTLDHLEKLTEELSEAIKQLKKTITTEEILKIIFDLTGYKNNKEKFETTNNIDISNVLANDFFAENTELVNSNKALYSVLQAVNNIEQNKFGHWGFYNWREVMPKTINDKIYLVLKYNNNKPMHFVKITDRINEFGFDNKKANAATVHNELILDKKYVLVGRGLYGLKDWGYEKGTVADVIENIIIQNGKPMSREEIINKVSEQRLVKKATIVLALMNKDRFAKEKDKYQLKR